LKQIGPRKTKRNYAVKEAGAQFAFRQREIDAEPAGNESGMALPAEDSGCQKLI